MSDLSRVVQPRQIWADLRDGQNFCLSKCLIFDRAAGVFRFLAKLGTTAGVADAALSQHDLLLASVRNDGSVFAGNDNGICAGVLHSVG